MQEDAIRTDVTVAVQGHAAVVAVERLEVAAPGLAALVVGAQKVAAVGARDMVRRRGGTWRRSPWARQPELGATRLHVVMVEASDAVLIAAARDGDLDAFASLVRRHQLAVYRVALRMLACEADAEDVAQETFVQVWRSLGRFRGDSALATWLYRIVTNRSLNVLASRRPTVPLTEHQTATTGDPGEALERRERLRALTEGLLALAPEQRAVLVLREFEGLSYQEISEVLEISVSAVKGRVHRARAALVAVLGGAS